MAKYVEIIMQKLPADDITCMPSIKNTLQYFNHNGRGAKVELEVNNRVLELRKFLGQVA